MFLIYNEESGDCYNYEPDLQESSFGPCSIYDSAFFDIYLRCNNKGIMDCDQFTADYQHDGKYLVVYKYKSDGSYLTSVVHRRVYPSDDYEIAADEFKISPGVPLSERFKFSSFLPIPVNSNFPGVVQHRMLEGYEFVSETEFDFYVAPKPNPGGGTTEPWKVWFPDYGKNDLGEDKVLCRDDEFPLKDGLQVSYQTCCKNFYPGQEQECEANSAKALAAKPESKKWFPDTENSLCKHEKNPPKDIHPSSYYRECCWRFMPGKQQECNTNSANWFLETQTKK